MTAGDLNSSESGNKTQIVEQGWLQIQVKWLQQNTTLDSDIEVSTVLMTAEFISDGNCSVKSFVIHRTESNIDLSDCLHFPIKSPNENVTFEIKIQASNGNAIGRQDFGSARISFVPALEWKGDSKLLSLFDRFGKPNNFRLNVIWEYKPYISDVKASVFSTAIQQDPAQNSMTQFNFVRSKERGIFQSMEQTLSQICQGGTCESPIPATLHILCRFFRLFFRAACACRLARMMESSKLKGHECVTWNGAEAAAAAKLQAFMRMYLCRCPQVKGVDRYLTRGGSLVVLEHSKDRDGRGYKEDRSCDVEDMLACLEALTIDGRSLRQECLPRNTPELRVYYSRRTKVGRDETLDPDSMARAVHATLSLLQGQVRVGAGILRCLQPAGEEAAKLSTAALGLMKVGRLVVYSKEQVVFEQHAPADSFGIVCAGSVRVVFNHRKVCTLVAGQSFSDLGLLSLPALATPGCDNSATVVHGATFATTDTSLVLQVSYQRFLDLVCSQGPQAEESLRSFLAQSDSIGRETWSAYGSAAKSIEMSFLFFMSNRSGIFGLLNLDEVRTLSSMASYHKFQAKDILCKQNDAADGIFVILTGVAAIFVDGKQVAFSWRGDIVGEMGLIGNFGRKRSASMIAHYDCEVAMITYDGFMTFVDSLSQTQAHRIACYVAESVLPKYLANLSLRRAMEAELIAHPKHSTSTSARRGSESLRANPKDLVTARRLEEHETTSRPPLYRGISAPRLTARPQTARPHHTNKTEEEASMRWRDDNLGGRASCGDAVSQGWATPRQIWSRLTSPPLRPKIDSDRGKRKSWVMNQARDMVRGRPKTFDQLRHLLPIEVECCGLDEVKGDCNGNRDVQECHVANEKQLEGVGLVIKRLEECFGHIATSLVAFGISQDSSISVLSLVSNLKSVGMDCHAICASLGVLKGCLNGNKIKGIDFMLKFDWESNSKKSLLDALRVEKARAADIATQYQLLLRTTERRRQILCGYQFMLQCMGADLQTWMNILKYPQSQWKLEFQKLVSALQLEPHEVAGSELVPEGVENSGIESKKVDGEMVETCLAILVEVSYGSMSLEQAEAVVQDSLFRPPFKVGFLGNSW